MSDFFARTAAYSYHLYLSADGGGKFWLSATDGEGPVLLRDALTPLPRYMLPEYRLNREETPIRASRLLVVRDTLLKAIGRGDAPGLHLHLGDEVELAMMADPDGDYGVTFFLDHERSSLIGRLPEGSTYLESGWLGRFGDNGYELIDLPGFEEDDLDWIGRRIGTDEWEELLVQAIPAMRDRSLRVHSEIEYSPEPVGHIDITDCGEDYAAVEVASGNETLRLQGLDGYVLQAAWTDAKADKQEGGQADYSEAQILLESLPDSPEPDARGTFFMRPAMDREQMRRLFGSESGGTVRGDELAEFARLVEREWGAMVTGDALVRFRDMHRLYDASDWSWSLRGGPVPDRGVGVVHAEPVLSVGEQKFTAAELTDAWSEGRRYLRLEDGWIDLEAPEFARSLREHGAGGGSAGLISAGFSYRQRIGLPGESIAGELPIELEGPKPVESEETSPALVHLRYLTGWGMNGGLYGGVEHRLQELRTWIAETLSASPDCRMLVVGRRELLAALAEHSDPVDPPPKAGLPVRFLESSPNEEEDTKQAGLILVPVSSLQRADFEAPLRADILLLLEPDTSVRSDETRLFSRIDAAEARVRLAIYSDEGQMNDARVRAVQVRLLKLYDSLTRSYLLIDPNKGKPAAGARPPLRDVPSFQLPSWRKEDGMAEMFVDEAKVQSQTPPSRGMAIPPRVDGGGGRSFDASRGRSGASGSEREPDPRDIQTSRPEPERTPSYIPPKRRQPAYGGEARPIRPVQQQSAEREFIERAREHADRTESEVPFVSFSSYWPTYAAMKPEQEQWYFYWRTQFRRGEKVETDLSYLFIYVYELINGVGWDNPQDGLSAMIRVWENYRARFRRLDGYMADWVREFALVNSLDLPDSTALEQTAGQLKGELLDLELSRRLEESPAELTWELIARLSDYDMTTSRFYKDAGKKALPRVLPHVVRAIDEHLITTRGIRLTGLFRAADIRITERYLFRSAVYDPETYGRTFLVRAPKLSLHAQLRDFMTQVTRQTENELRARFKFGGRLRGIKLDPEISETIAAAVEREFVPPEERVLPEPPKRPEVRFNLEELDKLRRDSDEVLRMLTGELMSAGDAAKSIAEPKTEAQGETAEYEGFETMELPEDAEEGWSVDAVPGALSFDPVAGGSKIEGKASDPVRSSEAGQDHSNAWENDPAIQLSNAGTPASDVPFSEPQPSDRESLEADTNLVEPSSVSEDDWDAEALDEDWQSLAALLTSADRQMLRAVLLHASDAERMSIAGATGELPETVIDRINEAAMETIGDLLIDAGEVLEEYVPILERLYER
ncbi:TerB N-terminal domain-containing protein [Saccharibacillus sacchari]|uniref:TerB N-terminal domain-containing protein n=1 Tax=Saccharibacillus sacchari TaxID=456493 RepID=UPI0004B3BF87|nr:TerB N-terminal domain-containing protein [Saccharibacillus sacchari]